MPTSSNISDPHVSLGSPDPKKSPTAMNLTVSKENYLKTIAETESEGEVVISASLARSLGVSPPAVTAGLQRLKRDGMIRTSKGGSLSLTDAGRAIADRVLRRHHLIERMLTEMFAMEWYKVHDEAERLEHAVSEDFEARLMAVLGDSKPCPHGSIVESDSPNERRKRGWVLLDEVSETGEFVVACVFERDRRLLEFLDRLALRPGQKIFWVERLYDETIVLGVKGARIQLGSSATRRIWVKPGGIVRGRRRRT